MNIPFQSWISHQYRRSSIKPLQYLKFLDKSQWWERDRLEKIQLENFKKLIRKAVEKSPYYQDLLKDLNPDMFTLKDIKSLPVLTKEILRAKTRELRPEQDNHEVIEAVTSGSTGSPVTIFRSKEASAIHLAGHFRFHSWWGVKPGDRHVLIWGNQKKNEKNRILKKKVKEKILKPPFVIDVFDLNKDTIKDFIQSMIAYNPIYIRGYVSAIKYLYRLVREHDIDISGLRPRVIIATSEVLYLHDREFIEKISGVRVANEFGSRDGGQFAYECPDGSLHLEEEYEYVWTDTNFELVGTELHNFAMPMVNYKVGDRVIVSNEFCPCGRKSRILESIEGKTRDMVVKPDGLKVSSRIFFDIFKDPGLIDSENNVKQFQVKQRGNHFDFQIEKEKNFDRNKLLYIEDKMKENIGSNIEISFHFPQDIRKERSGKFRYFVQLT